MTANCSNTVTASLEIHRESEWAGLQTRLMLAQPLCTDVDIHYV